MQQDALDFHDESEALHALTESLSDAELRQPTAFKRWTIERVLRHLHVWNHAAALSLVDAERFALWYARAIPYRLAGTLEHFEELACDGLAGRALLAAWRTQCRKTAECFATADPKARVAWAGKEMSARSSITARLMETWAHGQAIHDLLGVYRRSTDRIRGIAVLGFNTYGWSFRNRGMEPPSPPPCLRLTAPSGAYWRFGEENPKECIVGPAEEFCQVVTQTRNIADTSLQLTGANAAAWMAIAQCFAGPPEAPPAAGSRAPSR